MKQPELGKKVTEIRQQLAITQEQLAAECEVSTRTIQRIESGDVDPRAFTIERLSEALEFDFGASSLDNEPFWLAILHLSSVFSIIFIPLVIWSLFKQRSYKIDQHGKDVLNFQITINLLLIAAVVILMAVPMVLMIGVDARQAIETPRVLMATCSIFPLLFVGFFTFWQGIMNTVRVLADKPYKYLLSIPFIR